MGELTEGYVWGRGPLDCSTDLAGRLRTWFREADAALRLPADVSASAQWAIGTGALIPPSQGLLNLLLGPGRPLSGAGPDRLYAVWDSYRKDPQPTRDQVPAPVYPSDLVGPGANLRLWQSRLYLLGEFFLILSTVPVLTADARLLASVCRLRAMDRAAAEADIAAPDAAARRLGWVRDHPQLAEQMPLQFGSTTAAVSAAVAAADRAAHVWDGSPAPAASSAVLASAVPEVAAAIPAGTAVAGDAFSGLVEQVRTAAYPADPVRLAALTTYLAELDLAVAAAVGPGPASPPAQQLLAAVREAIRSLVAQDAQSRPTPDAPPVSNTEVAAGEPAAPTDPGTAATTTPGDPAPSTGPGLVGQPELSAAVTTAEHMLRAGRPVRMLISGPVGVGARRASRYLAGVAGAAQLLDVRVEQWDTRESAAADVAAIARGQRLGGRADRLAGPGVDGRRWVLRSRAARAGARVGRPGAGGGHRRGRSA